MLDVSIQSAVEQWLSDPAIADADKREIRALVESGAHQELTDRFYRDLEFGTGGMRGILGAGRNRMNVYTVGAAAQGLANYLLKQSKGPFSVAIAYDCRRQSDVFARRLARIMAGNGIRAHLFESLRPTPELSFAIRHLGCNAGVMITASHNPPEYNGLKVYWNDGAQVVPPHDEGIIAEVRAVSAYSSIIECRDDDPAMADRVQLHGRDIDEAFLKTVDATCLCPELSRKHGARLKIVYTPLHGTGHALVPAALRRRGFEHMLVEPEQAIPSGEFPTVKSPNPEEPAAMERAVALARQSHADIVLATDPDADRVGMAVRRADGAYELLSGNRIGAILTYFVCEQLKARGAFPSNGVVLSTVVSSDLAKEIARRNGAEVVETLTGFKWIAAEIGRYEREGSGGHPKRQLLMGMEESYGYLPHAFVRDKDAVTSCAFLADAAAFATERGTSLHGILESIFTQYGYFQEGARSITLKGKAGAEQITAIMTALRNEPPRDIGGAGVETVADLLTGVVRRISDGNETGRYTLPPSDVLIFTRTDGTKVISRPSGTEPKIKFYILTRSTEKNIEKAEAACQAMIREINADITRFIERLGVPLS